MSCNNVQSYWVKNAIAKAVKIAFAKAVNIAVAKAVNIAVTNANRISNDENARAVANAVNIAVTNANMSANETALTVANDANDAKNLAVKQERIQAEKDATDAIDAARDAARDDIYEKRTNIQTYDGACRAASEAAVRDNVIIRDNTTTEDEIHDALSRLRSAKILASSSLSDANALDVETNTLFDNVFNTTTYVTVSKYISENVGFLVNINSNNVTINTLNDNIKLLLNIASASNGGNTYTLTNNVTIYTDETLIIYSDETLIINGNGNYSFTNEGTIINCGIIDGTEYIVGNGPIDNRLG